ncbi:hypothetical protein ABZ883_07885 [Streptomyces sp. NPDC046977]|uniref:hypothetical protein n=1 Tax=Streptomyces sp. NPDC046977 TaxID=3154703 RepID=UPI0033ED93BE
MTTVTDSGPVAEFRRLSDGDAEVQAHGAHFSCSYLLDMGRHRFLVRMHRGRVEELVTDPEPLEGYDFAIRASAGTWAEFCAPMPKPMYHGIWAATFQRDMRLEGDLLVLMQNLRCLTRQLELLRVTGPLG